MFRDRGDDVTPSRQSEGTRKFSFDMVPCPSPVVAHRDPARGVDGEIDGIMTSIYDLAHTRES